MLRILKFENPFCVPCKNIEETLTSLQNSMGFSLEHINTYTDEGAELAQEYSVMSTPTLILEKSGEVVEKIISVKSEKEYREIIGEFM